MSFSSGIGSASTPLDALRGRFHPAGNLRSCPEEPRGDCRLLGAQQLRRLPVAEARHVDRHESVAELVGKAGDDGEHLARLDRLLRSGRRAGVDRLGPVGQRIRREPSGRGAARADEGVPQGLEEVPQVVCVAHPAWFGEHAREGLLDQVFGLGAGAGHRPRRPEQAIDVVAQRGGITQMTITSHAKRPSILIATVVALVLAALGLPPGASASSSGVRGVDAEIDNGTLNVNGGDRPNAVALRLRAGDPTRIQVDAGDNGSADFAFARADVRAISIRMGNGRDSVRIDDANGAFTDAIPTAIAGGNGDDTLNGGLGVETFSGGNGDDFVDGGRGNDRADLGRGDDTFQWDPGEGSDAIEGESGSDRMLFNGAAGGETVTMSANGGRLIFFRQ